MLATSFQGGHLPSVCDRQLQVFHSYSFGCILFLGLLPGSSSSSGGMLCSASGTMEASEMRVPRAAGFVPRLHSLVACTAVASQKSPFPACVRAGRLDRLTGTKLCTARECSSGCWLFLGTAGRLAGMFHTLKAAAASVPPIADFAQPAFYSGPAKPGHMEVYRVWWW